MSDLERFVGGRGHQAERVVRRKGEVTHGAAVVAQLEHEGATVGGPQADPPVRVPGGQRVYTGEVVPAKKTARVRLESPMLWCSHIYRARPGVSDVFFM